MNKKSLIIIMVLIVIAALSGFWYVANKKEQVAIQNLNQNQENDRKEVDNNKVYKNDKYGFSFQYPIEWDILEKDNSVYVFQPGKEYNIENTKTYPISLRFDFENYAGKKTLDEWAQGKSNIKLGEKEIKNITVDGKAAVRAKTYLGTETLILVNEKENKQLILSTENFGDESINTENLKVYSSILESFDFQ